MIPAPFHEYGGTCGNVSVSRVLPGRVIPPQRHRTTLAAHYTATTRVRPTASCVFHAA
jgi:hypothetical protein